MGNSMIYVGAHGDARHPAGIYGLTSPDGPALLLAEVDRPSFMTTSGEVLYAVSGVEAGWAHAWRMAGEELIRIGVPVNTGGEEPCHLVVDPSGTLLIVANYGSSEAGSVAVLPLAPDGSIGPAVALTRQTEPGPVADRQPFSHAHQVVVTDQVEEPEVLVVDLGADQVVSYLLVAGELTDPVVSAAPVGSGPRHLRVLDDDQVVISGELDSTLLLARRDGRRLVDWRSTPSTGSVGVPNFPSDLLVDGALVHLANRGADTVATIEAETGRIVTETPCGAWPRQLALDAGSLYVASTNSDLLVRIDLDTGRRQDLPMPQPMCVLVRHLTDGPVR